MLGFFRKYQKYFFIVVTVVIVISFSFFGTYNTIPGENIREQVAFVAVDGTEVKRSDLDEMVMFIGSDAEDKLLFGGVWGPNFLNDGVLKKDFLQTGLAVALAEHYPVEIAVDLKPKAEKEKRYLLYTHPDAQFLSAESAWSYFAPDMKTNFAALQKAQDVTDPKAFAARARLFVGERRFPSSALRQVLKYQEKQYSWLKPDPTLDRADLSLFGYHTVEDWFGPRFIRLMAQFIINTSKIAEQKGYRVSKEEALADLMQNAQKSFQQNRENPNVGVANSTEYFNEQLRRMGMDQTMAVKVWRQVLLSRRLFLDVGSSVFVDPYTFNQYTAYAKESVSGDLYQLPKELQLSDARALQKLEVYLNAVSKRGESEKALSALPTTFLKPADVAETTPELVQKRYVLEIARIDKKNLQTRVGVKEMWAWEMEDSHWGELKKEFPVLGVKKGDTREERFAALESLDQKSRGKVDTFARKAVLNAHPEWIDQALSDADVKKQTIGIRLKGESLPFQGLDQPRALITLLDKAPVAGEEGAEQATDTLSRYTQDQEHYYRIRVLDKGPALEILTFAEADSKGILNGLIDVQLESYYLKIREAQPGQYQKDDKSWKTLAEVREQVADLYFAKIMKAVKADVAKIKPDEKLTTGDLTAPWRLYGYVNDVKEKLEKGEDSSLFIKEPSTPTAADALSVRDDLAGQWKLEKTAYRLDRTGADKTLDVHAVFALKENAWSPLQRAPNGEIVFFRKTKANDGLEGNLADEKIEQARRLLADDVQLRLMRHLLIDYKAKHALSLDYLNQGTSMTPEES